MPVIGQVLRFARDSLGLMQEAAAYGDLVTISTRPLLLYLLNHPDLVHAVLVKQSKRVGRGRYAETLKYLMGEGLVTSGGALHARQRRLMQPHFHHNRIADYGRIMADYARQHEEGWVDGARVDLAEEMSDLTLHIVVRTLFGLDLPDDVKRLGVAFDIGNDYVMIRNRQPDWMCHLAHALPLPRTRRFRRALAYLDQTVNRLIAERRASGLDGDDLLSLLLQTHDDEAEDPRARVMTDQQLRDETITLFAAGHETTAVALAWTGYLLARHPDMQDKLHAELDAVLGDREPTVDDLSQLVFTDQVVTESMRLYPPVWTTGRMALESFELAGYQIPAGAMLAAPQILLHRDARWFADPLEFRPERWTPEFRKQLPRYAYFPFGGGPRVCIGAGFAWMEAKLVLATIGQRWRMQPDPKHKIVLRPLVTLRPQGGMPMFLERRHRA